MKRFWRRVLAGAMAAILAVSLLPTPALAALWDNSSDYNQEILDELRALCGIDGASICRRALEVINHG